MNPRRADSGSPLLFLLLFAWEYAMLGQIVTHEEVLSMRLAVPYEPETETVAEHFGHAKWMKLYNEEGTVVFTDVVESPANGHEGVCKFLKEHGVEVVLCNGLGEEARDALFEHSIAVLAGLYGKADDLVIAMLENRLRYGTPDATCHHEGGCSCGCSCGEDGCGDDCGCGCGV